MNELYLVHHGIKGQKWGVRRFQNKDGTMTDAGRKRYKLNPIAQFGVDRVNRRSAYETAMNKAKKENRKAAKNSKTLGEKLSNTIGPKAIARKKKAYKDYNEKFLSKNGKKEVTKADRAKDFAATFAYTLGKEAAVRVLTKTLVDNGHPVAAVGVKLIYKNHKKPISDGEKAARKVIMAYNVYNTAKVVRKVAKPFVEEHNRRVREYADREGLNYVDRKGNVINNANNRSGSGSNAGYGSQTSYGSSTGTSLVRYASTYDYKKRRY